MPKSASELTPIFSSPRDINDATDRAMMDGITKQFPIETGKYTLTVVDPHVDKKEYTTADEKDAILQSRSLTYPIRGTLLLHDRGTGKLVDRVQNFALADTFHVTNKHTLLYKGNNYSVANLMQLRPGVYTRKTNNGELETNINTGKGATFSLGLDSKTMEIYFSKINGNGLKIPIAPLLTKGFHLSDADIQQFVPSDVWQANKKLTAGKEEVILNQLYRRLVDRREQSKGVSVEEMGAALKHRLGEMTLDKQTTEITLGKSFGGIEPEALLRAMRNIVQVYSKKRPEDNRDSLQFKRVQNLPDFIGRRFEENKQHQTVGKAFDRIKFNLSKLKDDAPSLREVLPAKPFNKIYTDFVIGSQLSSTPDETNPIESIENVGKVTLIAQGEGGMSSERQATMESRNVHPSNLGIIDPSRTPESSSAGLDQRFTISARRDKEGGMYARAIDAKTGKTVYLSANELMTKKVGFPDGRKNGKPTVQAQVNGEFKSIPRSEVEYWIPSGTDMYTITTNLVPFLNTNHPGRLTMAGKAIPQALSLVHREAPLVQTLTDTGHTFVKQIGQIVSTVAPVTGTVTKADASSVHIKGEDGKEHRVDFVKNLPFNMKGFHDDEPHNLHAGDTVAAGQVLSDNNYTKNGDFAIGKNLQTAYMPFKGFNHEDGIVVSRSATSKLTSNHAYKVEYNVGKETISDLAKYKAAFGGKFTAEQLNKLDSRGFAKPGVTLHYGDPVYAVLEERQLTETDMVLGRLHKTLVNPYRSASEIWDHEEPGVVTDCSTDGKKVRIMLRSERALDVGDKVTGLHGNKGVVSAILEDDEMPHANGKPLDMILNPASVTSRINLGQVFEAAAGKIAEKTGKPYKTKVFEHGDGKAIVKHLQDELAQHGLSDTDKVYDPKTGHVYGEKVLTGPQYILKLNKTTDANYSARSVGGYDNNAQPTKGGDDGAKSVGYMEFLGLLGSNARANLKEIGTVKSEGGDHADTHDYWDKFMRGLPLPQPRTTFATKKFFDYLKGSGISVSERNGSLVAGPMTDREVLLQSSGEIQKPDMILARNVAPVKGGLFDMTVTGGPEGTNWSHYKLMEPIVNPVMEDPVKHLLGLNQKEFDGVVSGKFGVKKIADGHYHLVDTHDNDKMLKSINVSGLLKKEAETAGETLVGGHALKTMLGDINVQEELAHLKEAVGTEKSVAKRDKMVKRMKYLAGLDKQGFNDPSKAYVLSHMPVIPPVMRPYSISGSRLSYADVNELYKHHMLVNGRMKRLDEEIGMDMLSPDMEGMVDLRRDLYNGAKAIMASGEPIDFQAKQKGIKGLMKQIEGNEGPKNGYFQSKLLSKKQDFSGRGTIYAAPDVGFNEAKIPKDQLWEMYKMHIIRDLSQKGYDLADAKKAYEERNDAAMASFNHMVDTVPVLLNRAPTLMRTNIMAMKPIPSEGKTIGLNILHLPGYAADYDGDALSMYLPMTPEAVKEAREKLMPSNHLHDARRGFGTPMFAPGHEAILGSVHLTKPDMEKKVHEFKTEEEALKAFHAGEIDSNTPIKIG